jgi:hypothetical protein
MKPAMLRPILDLQKQIRGKAPKEVAAMIVQKFGPPDRDWGSGVEYLVWDIGGGELAVCVQGGPPTFGISWHILINPPKTQSFHSIM